MDDKVEELSAVVFHEKLGTMRQKVERMIRLSEVIATRLVYSAQEMIATSRAAYLAKADLGSRVVYEFPELQGIIGEYYALAAGEDTVVAQAVREHYLPRFAGDDLPESKPGIAVALADKLDSIAGFFAMGMIPSGSQDPYALRRAAAVSYTHLKITIETPAGQEEELTMLLFDLGALGVAVDDPALIKAHLERGDWDASVYDAMQILSLIHIYQLMLGAALGGEAKHGNARLLNTNNIDCRMVAAVSYLSQLF